MYNFFQSTS